MYCKTKLLKGSKITLREDRTKFKVELIKNATDIFGAKNEWT